MKKDLKILQKGNIILVVGNTGCGKSTMLSSFIYGPDSLTSTTIEMENGKKRTVIDHKNSKKKELKIGHSQAESETFVPNFILEP